MSQPEAATLPRPRVDGRVAIATARRGEVDYVARLVEAGGYRARVTGDRPLVVNLVNPTGGLAGGDVCNVAAEVAAHTRLTITSVAPERVYRSGGAETRVHQRLGIAPHAHAAWLPHPTVFHEGARYRRRLDVHVAAEGRALVADALAFGRAARDERLADVELRDDWRIHVGGLLAFAESLRMDGRATAALRSWPRGAGDRAAGLCVYVGPDAASRADAARAAAWAGGGAATVVGGVLVARWVAPAVETVAAALRSYVLELDPVAIPRGW